MNDLTNNNSTTIVTTGRLKEIETEIFAIGEQIQNSYISMGKRILEAKNICNSDETLNFQDWCENNIGLRYENCNRIIRIYEVLSSSPEINELKLMDCKNSFRKLDAICMLAEPVKEYNEDTKKNVQVKDEEGKRVFDTSEVMKFLENNPDILNSSLTKVREEVLKVREEKDDIIKNLENKLTTSKIATTNAETQAKKLQAALDKLNKDKDSLIDEAVKQELAAKTSQLNKEKARLDDLMNRYSTLSEKAEAKLEEAKKKEEDLKSRQKLINDSKETLDKLKEDIAVLANEKDDIIAGANRIGEFKELLSIIDTTLSMINKFELPAYDKYFSEGSNIKPYISEGFTHLEIAYNKFKNRLNNSNNYNDAIEIVYEEIEK